MKKTILLLSLSIMYGLTGTTQAPVISMLQEDKQQLAKTNFLSNAGTDYDGGKVFGGAVYSSAKSGLKKTFTIKVSDPGSYFFAAHVMGIRSVPVNASNVETGKVYPIQPVRVFVDGQYLGDLNLSSDQWQSAMVKGNEQLKLSQGLHTIVFESDGPSYPEVDAIRICRSGEKANFDMKYYDGYIAKLKANSEKNRDRRTKIEPEPPRPRDVRLPAATPSNADDAPVINSASNNTYSWEVTPTTLSNPAGDYRHIMTVPVVYTYYRQFSFNAGQSITFHTVPNGADSYYAVDPVMYVYCATNNTGWYNDDFTGLHPKVTFTAPVTGTYYLILRAYSGYYAGTSSGSQGVVNIYQNGSLLQTQAPVSGYMASMGSANSGIINFFTGYSTGSPKLWLTTAGNLSPIRFHGDKYWYISPMDYNWFNDARFRIQKSGSGNVDYSMLVSSDGAWYIYWGNCDLYGAVLSASSQTLSSFPNLKANDAMHTAPSTNTYNCAAWAGGLTNGWFWGCLYASQAGGNCIGLNLGSPNSWTTWDDYFGNNPPRYSGARNYTRTDANGSNAEVAIWSTNANISGITHLSVRRDGNNHPHGYDWESKPGGLERTFHPYNALRGTGTNSYGDIFAFYRDANRDPYTPWGRTSTALPAKPDFSMEESIAMGLTVLPKVVFTDEETAKVAGMLSKNNTAETRLEELYKKWIDACNAPELISNSNPNRFLELTECLNIVSFGEKNPEAAMAFIMRKIMNEEETSFEVQMSSLLLSILTVKKYGPLMGEVKEEWRRNNFTKEGSYIAPVPVANTKNYIKKILAEENQKEEATTKKNSTTDSYEQLMVYPNPVVAQSQLSIRIDADNTTVMAKLFNAKGIESGTIVNKRILNKGTHQFSINATDLEPGLYFCRITLNEQTYTRKVMVQ